MPNAVPGQRAVSIMPLGGEGQVWHGEGQRWAVKLRPGSNDAGEE
jgi:hypothetical protein